MSWFLVFWLQHPQNYAEYTQFKTERECKDSQLAWQRRLDIVKSKLIAECRERQ